MRQFYQELKKAVDSGKSFAVATVVKVRSSTPREPGAKMGVFTDGEIFGTIGGGKLEKLVIEDAVRAIASGKPVFKEYSLLPEEQDGIGSECGGQVEVFIEVPAENEKILLVGAGHVAMSIAQMAAPLGIHVAVVDDRDDFANKTRFPHADVHVCKIDETDFEKIVTPKTYIVILTREHEMDKEALAAVLDLPCAYIGMIGSQRKVKYIMDTLLAEGAEKDKLQEVHSPIGLDIGAETPAEIALSILGEIISLKRKGDSLISMKDTKPTF